MCGHGLCVVGLVSSAQFGKAKIPTMWAQYCPRCFNRCWCVNCLARIYAKRRETTFLGNQDGAAGDTCLAGAKKHSRLLREWMQNLRGKLTGRVSHCVHSYHMLSDSFLCFKSYRLCLCKNCFVFHAYKNENGVVPEKESAFMATKGVIACLGFSLWKDKGNMAMTRVKEQQLNQQQRAK